MSGYSRQRLIQAVAEIIQEMGIESRVESAGPYEFEREFLTGKLLDWYRAGQMAMQGRILSILEDIWGPDYVREILVLPLEDPA